MGIESTVVICGKEYWERIITFDELVLEGAISPEDVELFQYVETAAESLKLGKRYYSEIMIRVPLKVEGVIRRESERQIWKIQGLSLVFSLLSSPTQNRKT